MQTQNHITSTPPTNNNTSCLICYLPPTSNNPRIDLTCCPQAKVWIHKNCMEDMFRFDQQHQCPHCRRPITVKTVKDLSKRRHYRCQCNSYFCCVPLVKIVVLIIFWITGIILSIVLFAFMESNYDSIYEQCNPICQNEYKNTATEVQAKLSIVLIGIFVFIVQPLEATLIIFSTPMAERSCFPSDCFHNERQYLESIFELYNTESFKIYLIPANLFFKLFGARDKDNKIEYYQARLYITPILRIWITLTIGTVFLILDIINEHSFFVYLLVVYIPFLIQYSPLIAGAITSVLICYWKRGIGIEEVGQNRQIIVRLTDNKTIQNVNPAPIITQLPDPAIIVDQVLAMEPNTIETTPIIPTSNFDRIICPPPYPRENTSDTQSSVYDSYNPFTHISSDCMI